MNEFSYRWGEKRGPEKRIFQLASFFKGYDAYVSMIGKPELFVNISVEYVSWLESRSR